VIVRRALLAMAVLLVACTPAIPTEASPSPSGPQKVSITDKTPSELVAVMKAWQTAIGKKDLTGFQATIDLTRAAFRRCQTEIFDIAARQGFTQSEVKIAKVEPYLDAYVRAYVGDDASGYQRMYFRREGAKWIRSEPVDAELGGDQTKTVNGLQLSYYGIDNDVIDTYAAAGNDARAFLLKQAQGHTSTGDAFGLRIFPTRVHPALQQRALVQAGPRIGHRFDREHRAPRGSALAARSIHRGHQRADAVLARRGMARLHRPIAQPRDEEERHLQHADADVQAARGRRAPDARDATRAARPVLLVREHDGRIRLQDRRPQFVLGPHDRVQGRGGREGESAQGLGSHP
jgi:hypothetical protein